MTKNYREITAEVSANLAKLRADIPETMRGFASLAGAAGKDGALDKKTKELIAMALSVSARCDPCLGFHADALVKAGCSRAELEEMLGMCIYMGGGPSLMYAAHALQAYEQFGGATAR
jgi:AhpD family alkylhydroperoxidase